MADDEKDLQEKEEDIDMPEGAAGLLGDEDLPLSDEDDPLMGDFDEEEDDE
ncbi:MAG: hypothetical protein KBE09_00470 [Candidatus Pacebacteria bacterium]|nr:hypothetical protein [Candidatus Paceibacterota bacterium]